MVAQPNLERGVALTDVDRDGDTELAVTTGRQAGSFALEREERRWAGFRPFAAWPKVEGTVGRTFWVDLNGDGRADAVIARGDALVWFPSKTGPLDEVEREFGEPVVVPLPTGAEAAPGCGPNPQLDLFFADMTGDGLPDLVRVRRGTVEYWPSLGNGRFGERVVMAGAPAIPTATGFDSARVRLVDLDGSGTADVLYLDDGRLWHFPNLGGRQLGARREVGALPTFDGRSAAIADLAGDGRPSLLWSATSPTRGHALSYLPLVPATPPGMLIAIDDGCGRRTELEWGNSATHYLRDAADGVPWETRLPSHRPVIDARVELDLIGGTSVTTRYRYRDGYFDGAGGAFRGFGRVETLDVPQSLPRVGGGLGDGGVPAGASDEPAFAPPLLTRSWFHLGTAMWNHHRPFEPYASDPLLPAIGPHVEAPGAHLPADAAAALRLLAGSVVRRERWAVDAAEAPIAHPFDVEQASYQLVLSQPRRGAQRPVFGVVPRVWRVATYEGQGGDPRVTEELVLAHDVWGAPTRTAQVAYARRGAVDDAAQARTWVTVTDSGRADIDVDGQFLLGAELEASQRELVGVSSVGGRLGVEALTAPAVVAALASPAPFEQALDPAAPAPAARRLSWQRTYYWDAARAAQAAFGVVPKAPRVHHAEVACLTPGLVAATLAPRVDAAGLAALGYVLADGHWWQRGPVQEVGGPFGLVTRTVRGDGASARMVYDSDALVVIEQLDALELSTTSLIDYRVMAPARTIDPNGTTSSAVHDGFGRVVASSVEGHVGAQPWKTGTAIGWGPGAATVASVLADPARYLGDAATATFIDDRAWARDATPIAEVMVARSALVDDGAGGGDKADPEVRVRYLDGFGRVLQEKVRVEAGPAIQRDASGAVIVDAGGRPVLGPAAERWQVSGHVVYDAKGQPGRVYEPYFSPSAGYESDAVLARFGVSTLTTYDAVGRAVRVDLPNGTYATTGYGAWATTAATPGDNVQGSLYRALREGLPAGDAERAAYEHAAAHAATPTVTHVDARGALCATEAVGDASAAAVWTRQVLDATGQATAVIDARGNEAFTYVRDLRGRVVAQTSVDAGAAWAVADGYDRAVQSWDARGYAVTRGFDVADRPTTVHVAGGDGATAMDAVVETYRYGDQAADRAAAVAANTLGRLVEVRDGAGVVTVTAYDPRGAVRVQGRQLRGKVNEEPEWRRAEDLEAEVLATEARTDALGREVWTQLADGTVRTSTYARGGALASVRATTPDGALVATPIVEGLTRDAHGRVVAATLGNGVGQTWGYDPASGRLVAQDAVRGTRAYQGLRCTYDPDGKLVRMLDVAQDGPGALVPGAVSARRDFGYDAHGRLVEATGRVHQALLPHDGPTTAGCVHGARHLSLNNGAALERYTQRFSYDAGGNLTRVQHAGTTASWATDYWVAAGANRATPAEDGNGVPVVDPAGMFDAGGNLRELWHLRALGWSWRGCLTHATTVARATGPVDDGERYAYGADRVRVRKVATRLVVGGAAPVVEEREVVYCGGGQERVRVTRNGTLVLERWTTHVGDGDRRVAVIDRHVIDTLANEVDAIGPARVRYHLTTPQGSTAVELDEAGLLVSYEEYLPFGGSAFVAGDDVREVARRDVRYAGKERDRATGMDAYPQRYYAPWLGRWLSPDPIGPKDGLNLYAFVHGDPIRNVDPEGTDTPEQEEKWMNRPVPAPAKRVAPPAETPPKATAAEGMAALGDPGDPTDYSRVLITTEFDPRSILHPRDLELVNRTLDTDHDKVISARELEALPKFHALSSDVAAAWRMAMVVQDGGGYRVDDSVDATLPVGARGAFLERLPFDPEKLKPVTDFELDARAIGPGYNRSARDVLEKPAPRKELGNLDSAVTALRLLPPVMAFEAGVKLRLAYDGRDLDGYKLSKKQRVELAVAGTLEFVDAVATSFGIAEGATAVRDFAAKGLPRTGLTAAEWERRALAADGSGLNYGPIGDEVPRGARPAASGARVPVYADDLAAGTGRSSAVPTEPHSPSLARAEVNEPGLVRLLDDSETFTGAAARSRYHNKWRPNPDGAVRTVDEAIEIAEAHGVEIHPDVEFKVAPRGFLRKDPVTGIEEFARYYTATGAADGRFFMSSLKGRSGTICVMVRADVLASDEAIVSIFGHEMYEINELQRIVGDGSISQVELRRLIHWDVPRNLHWYANAYGDALIDKMRQKAGELP